MNTSDVIASLPDLTPADRAKVIAACRHLGVEDAAPAVGKSVMSPAEMLWLGLVRTLKDQGSQAVPLGMAKKHRLWHKFAEEAAALDTWVTASFQPSDDMERLKSYRVSAGCVVRMYRKWNLNCVVPVLLRCVKDVQESVLAAFPGYAEAGALRRFVLLNTGSRSDDRA